MCPMSMPRGTTSEEHTHPPHKAQKVPERKDPPKAHQHARWSRPSLYDVSNLPLAHEDESMAIARHVHEEYVDSLEAEGQADTSVELQRARPCGVLHPNSARKRSWDGMVMATVIACGLLSPLDASFGPLGWTMRTVLIIADVTMLMDVLVRFNTGFFAFGALQLSRTAIARKQLGGTFAVDLLSIILPILGAVEEGWKELVIFRVLRVVHLARFAAPVVTHGLLASRVGTLLLCWCWWAHLVACVWHMFPRLFDSDEPNWLEAANLADGDDALIYIEAICAPAACPLGVVGAATHVRTLPQISRSPP